jgi:hypothetical protein
MAIFLLRWCSLDIGSAGLRLSKQHPADVESRNSTDELGDNERPDVQWTYARERVGECPGHGYGGIGEGR